MGFHLYVDVQVMFGPALSQSTISFLLIKIVFWKGIIVVKVKIIVHKLYLYATINGIIYFFLIAA